MFVSPIDILLFNCCNHSDIEGGKADNNLTVIILWAAKSEEFILQKRESKYPRINIKGSTLCEKPVTLL